ncbi:MAG: RND transporter [Bacteroidetes bacterium]|nr:MAG: RND transporter [Bacteroidota bacterium]PTM10422.1 MAG: RND transporter [Bacteroidota bacterium]
MTFAKWISWVLKYRVVILVLLLITVGTGLVQTARHLTVNNALSIWFLDDNPQYQQYLEFEKAQGSDQIIVAMIPVDSLYSGGYFDQLLRLHAATDTLPFIRATLSLANLKYPLYANQEIFFRDFYAPDRRPAWMAGLLTDLPDLRAQLVSADSAYTFFYLQLQPGNVIEQNRRAYVQQTVDLVRATVGPVHITGPPILNEAFSQTIYQESTFFAALTILVVVLLLVFLLPHWTYLPIAFAGVMITISVTLGLLASLGYSLNLISMLIPTILMIYAISDSIHIINIFHTYRKEHPEQDRATHIRVALQRSLKPCFYTTITTMIGYLALSVSPLPAFRVTGIFTFLGIAVAFGAAYLTTAIGFYYLPAASLRGRVQKINIRAIVDRLNNWTSARNGTVLVLGALVLVLGVGSLFFIRVSTNSMNLLGSGPVKTDLQLIEKSLQGSARLQLQISSADPDSLFTPANLARLVAFQDSLAGNPLLAHPVSILNFKSFLEDRMPVFSRFRSVNFEEVLKNSEREANPFFSFFADDLSQLAININLKELETEQLEHLLSSIREDFAATFPAGNYHLTINGFAAVYAQLNRFILQTQLWSFGSAFLLSFGILFYFIGNFKISILALLPNLLPLCVTVFAMALLGIPLEAANAMLAPIMLGVAMDDTIHLMNQYKRNRTAGLSVAEGMDQALHYTGGALFSTTIALVCGFLVVGFSGVASVATFGLLCAFTILVALLADVVVLPALVKRWG